MCRKGKSALLTVHVLYLVSAAQDNGRGQRLQCSHYRPKEPVRRPDVVGDPLEAAGDAPSSMPIVVYCHCNSGSRRDAEEALSVLLPTGITVFCFDFAVRFT